MPAPIAPFSRRALRELLRNGHQVQYIAAMRLVLLLVVVGAPVAFALPGEQVSKITLGAEEAAKTLTAPPPPLPLQPLAPSMLGAASSDTALRMRLVAMELRLLRFQRNDLVGPMFLTILGGTGVLGGLTAFAMSGVSGYGAFIVGLVMLMVSGGPLLIGLPWLLVAIARNATIDRELTKLEAEYTMLGGVSATEAPRPAAVVARF